MSVVFGLGSYVCRAGKDGILVALDGMLWR